MLTRTTLLAAACSALLTVTLAAPSVLAETAAPKAKAAPKTAAPKTAPTPAPVVPAASEAVFPKAVDPKYAKEKAGTARLHTCTDQYNANKATSANGGLKWIQKGGGYWSECTKRLKGSA